MGVPPSSVNCLVVVGFLPFALGAEAMRVPKPAAGMITNTFIAGCKYTRAGASVQIGARRAVCPYRAQRTSLLAGAFDHYRRGFLRLPVWDRRRCSHHDRWARLR